MPRRDAVRDALSACESVIRNAAEGGAFFVHNTCDAAGRDECETLRGSCLLVLRQRWRAFLGLYDRKEGLGLRHLERQLSLDERLVMELAAVDDGDGLDRALAKRCAKVYVFGVLGECRRLVGEAVSEEEHRRKL